MTKPFGKNLWKHVVIVCVATKWIMHDKLQHHAMLCILLSSSCSMTFVMVSNTLLSFNKYLILLRLFHNWFRQTFLLLFNQQLDYLRSFYYSLLYKVVTTTLSFITTLFNQLNDTMLLPRSNSLNFVIISRLCKKA